MNQLDKKIKRLMETDPLDLAEKVGGTLDTGASFLLDKSDQLKKALHEQGDTHFGMSLEGYKGVFRSAGFEKVYSEPFTRVDRDHGEVKEALEVWWHGIGILLYSTTFTWPGSEPKFNIGYACFNWLSPDRRDSTFLRMSGSFHTDERGFLRAGNFDVREGLITRMKYMVENGKFLLPWEKEAFSFIAPYTSSDLPGDLHDRINGSIRHTIGVVNMLPKPVRDSILYDKREHPHTRRKK